MSSFYNINIAGASLASPSDGFVDNTTIQGYNVNLESPPTGFTLAEATTKRKANIRFREIVLNLNLQANIIINPASISAPGGAYDAPPTSFGFQIMVEHGDSSLYTEDELNSGSYLTGVAALKRMISRGLMFTSTTYVRDVVNPTETLPQGSSSTLTFPRAVESVGVIDIGPLAASLTAADALTTVTALVLSPTPGNPRPTS